MYPQLSKFSGGEFTVNINFLKDDNDFIFRLEDEVYVLMTINHNNSTVGGHIDSPVRRFKGSINYMGYATFKLSQKDLELFEEGTQLAEIEIDYASEVDCDGKPILVTKGYYPHQGYLTVEIVE